MKSNRTIQSFHPKNNSTTCSSRRRTNFTTMDDVTSHIDLIFIASLSAIQVKTIWHLLLRGDQIITMVSLFNLQSNNSTYLQIHTFTQIISINKNI
jgi:hypothetical protein